jgi:hypothetical protein
MRGESTIRTMGTVAMSVESKSITLLIRSLVVFTVGLIASNVMKTFSYQIVGRCDSRDQQGNDP